MTDSNTDSSTDGDGTRTRDEPLLSLTTALRDDLKEPFGPIETDVETLLERAGRPIVAVGDVVTYHLRQAGHRPAVAVVGGRTKRSEVDDAIRAVVTQGVTTEVVNPPATITESLVDALCTAISTDEPTTILVDGEEDLATLPALLAAPEGASVVYGQPDEGMVLVTVTDDVRKEVRALLERFDGDHERVVSMCSRS